MRTVFGGMMAITLLVSALIFFQAFKADEAPIADAAPSVEKSDVQTENATQNEDVQPLAEHDDLSDAARRLEYQNEIWALDYLASDEALDFERSYPENINVFLAETVDYRLDTVDIENLPEEVVIAIWPDNVLTLTDRQYVLLNPPSDIMKAYYVPAVIEDVGDLYFDAMVGSKGLFVNDEEMLLQDSPLGRMVIASLAEQEKMVVAYQNSIDPELNQVISKTKLAFEKIDYVIDPEATDISVTDQWQRILDRAIHGEEINVLMNAHGEAVEELKSAMKKDDETGENSETAPQ